MRVWLMEGLGRKVVVRAADEGSARELMAGPPEKREEKWLSHDHAASVDLSEGPAGVLHEMTAAEARKAKAAGE